MPNSGKAGHQRVGALRVRTVCRPRRPSPAPAGSPGAAAGRRTAPSLRAARLPARSPVRQAGRCSGRASPTARRACASRHSWPRRSSRPRWEWSVLAALLHHPAAVLDAPLRHGHVADGREDVGVEARLASLHGAGLLAALDRVLEVLLAEHPDRSRRAHVSADGRRLLGVECCLGLREDRAGLLLGGSAAQHPLPRLALAGRRPEHDLVLVAARSRCVEPHPPRPRAAAQRARLALREQLRLRARRPRAPPRLEEPSYAGFVYHSRASLRRK